ncbi:MAG TPA: hypothetical protein VL944_00865 [Candidatus Acidoferrum sp.]|nr:hypothetical protein [Candidatus Acidoferrum sp.]
MKRAWIVLIAVIAISTVIAFVETNGFHISIGTHTTTVPLGSKNSTSSSTTTTKNTSVLYACYDYVLSADELNATTSSRCLLTVNTIGIWVAAGNSNSIHLTMIGADNKTYINQTITYSCITFFRNLTAPMQAYNVILTTGASNGTCGYSIVKFNETTVAPHSVYDFIYNGNFTSGAYTGWNITGAGFGTAPLNLTHADNSSCYVGSPWSNIPGQFVASTYSCGLQASPGNLTSSPFIASEPFINFKIVSKPHAGLYIEVLTNDSPAIIAVYNTYNISQPGNSSSTFRNATIPLTNVVGKVVRLRIVSATTTKQNFIVAGGFYLSSKPTQQYGWITTNLTIYNTT